MKKTYALIFPFFIASLLLAHGDLHQRIMQLTAQISEHPDSAFLYLKRGELYFQHEEYKASLKDLKRCSKLGYNNPRLHLAFANTYGHIGKQKSALKHLRKILKDDAKDVKALKLKGHLLFKKKQFSKSAACFEKVIAHTDKTVPENYLDASLAWEQSKVENSLLKAANTIQAGINKLGTLIVFYDRLIELHLLTKNYDSAIQYATKVLDQLNRKETAYYKRALLYIEKGDKLSAKGDLLKSQEVIDQLPHSIKNNTAMLDLKSKVTALLKDL